MTWRRNWHISFSSPLVSSQKIWNAEVGMKNC
nr:MAG TPA: hypothetical protein [Caudoviricetes sp.]